MPRLSIRNHLQGLSIVLHVCLIGMMTISGCISKATPDGMEGKYEDAGNLLSVYREGFDPPAGVAELSSPHGVRLIFGTVPSHANLLAIQEQKPSALSIPYWWFETVFSEPRLPTMQAVYVTPFKNKSLDLREVKINGHFSSVKTLQIPFAVGVDEGLDELLKHFPNLEFIDLSYSDLSDKSFEKLARSEKIHYLYIPHTRVTNASAPLYQERNQSIEIQAKGTPLQPDVD